MVAVTVTAFVSKILRHNDVCGSRLTCSQLDERNSIGVSRQVSDLAVNKLGSNKSGGINQAVR
jgi:hypothetical protein